MSKSTKTPVDRRDFLKRAAVGAAALAAIPAAGMTQPSLPAQTAGGAQPLSKEAETGTPQPAEVLTTDRTGSDFMVDVIKSLGLEYICANPGSTFRGLHESVVNYGGNSSPELITCCHEESAVGMAHGYAKIEGKPIGVLIHSTVGLQHASMAIFNAYCDRVPVYLIAGNTIDVPQRRPGVEWDHSAVDLAAMVRDFVKWDDLPISLTHFAESAVRAYKIAMTPPRMPVLIVADSELQEHEIAKDAGLRVPKLTLSSPPQGDSGAVTEAAKMLVAAQNPVLVVDRAARTADGMKLIAQLAETLQAGVVDNTGRMNFPSRHPLNQSDRAPAAIASADVILGLEVSDLWGTLHAYRDQLQRSSKPITKADTKVISIGISDLFSKGNFQDLQRYEEVDLAISGDAEATLPSLIEAVQHQLTGDRKTAFEDRGRKWAAAHQRALDQARNEATYGWDASPISTARLSAEVWDQIRTEDWSLVWIFPRGSVSGPCGYGRSRSITTSSAARADMAWDMELRPR
jgi:acetolactate synthase-1/2/3 large subunit